MSLLAALQFIGILADYECPYQQRYNLLEFWRTMNVLISSATIYWNFGGL